MWGDSMSVRWKYAVAFICLLLIEIIIALYVDDLWVRPYIGDVLVVILLYTLIRSFTEKPKRYLPIYLFLFASGIELLQYFKWVTFLGLQENHVLATIMGTTFDIKDIGCYAIGTLLLMVWEKYRSSKRVQ